MKVFYLGISGLVVLFTTLVIFFRRTRRSALPLPPGPKGLPLIGNLLDMPAVHEQITYAKWGKQYGDVVHITVLGKHIIILNTPMVANELLDQRSKIYSDRPYCPMAHEPTLMDARFIFGMNRYSDMWKRHRRLFMHHMSPSMVTQVFSSRQMMSTRVLLRQILSEPADFCQHLLYTTGNIILGIAYGYEAQLKDDPFARLSVEVLTTITQGFSPKLLVNNFPALRHLPSWIPGMGFKTFAADVRRAIKKLIEEPFEWAVKQMAEGNARPSFVQKALSEIGDATELEDIKQVSATMYTAAVDSTHSIVHAFILQMVLNPDIQRRAQGELDTILGSPDSALFRLPTFTDRPNLPYIQALAKEALRWHPPAPTGGPHAVTEEDEYRGWRIPKGSIVIPNAWGMLRNDNIYSDPYTFKPERFLSTKQKSAEPDPAVSGVFGFGRRACPGRLLGETSVWLLIANLLASFNFTPAKDDNGADIDITYASTPSPGFIMGTPPFPCSITPRSKYVEEAILQEDTHNEDYFALGAKLKFDFVENSIAIQPSKK